MGTRPIIFLEECNTEMSIWTEIPSKFDREDYLNMLGKFIHEGVAKLQVECKYRSVKPCIHIVPRRMSEEGFEELDRATWSAELSEVVANVESGNRSES